MDQFLPGFTDWWNSLAWGTVPDWFAAIGTVGAFAATIAIIQSERNQRRRAQADAFVSFTSLGWAPKIPLKGLSVRKMNKFKKEFGGLYHWEIKLWLHNTSNQPITYTMLRSDPRAGIDFHVRQTAKVGEKGLSIAPSEEVETTLPFEKGPRGLRIYLQFVDVAGRAWVREIMSGKYVSNRERREVRNIWRTQEHKWQNEIDKRNSGSAAGPA